MEECKYDKNKFNLKAILNKLYDIKIVRKKKSVHSVQFSFATKLIHTLDDTMPIYDSSIALLFNLEKKGRDKEEQISSCDNIYCKFQEDFKSVLNHKDIKEIIKEFREKFRWNEKEDVERVSDEKILDFILWTLGKIDKPPKGTNASRPAKSQKK